MIVRKSIGYITYVLNDRNLAIEHKIKEHEENKNRYGDDDGFWSKTINEELAELEICEKTLNILYEYDSKKIFDKIFEEDI